MKSLVMLRISIAEAARDATADISVVLFDMVFLIKWKMGWHKNIGKLFHKCILIGGCLRIMSILYLLRLA